jgi:very-short-patch-repair endonuclease
MRTHGPVSPMRATLNHMKDYESSLQSLRRYLDDWFATHDGIISRSQALEAGLSEAAIARLVRSGAWIRVYPNVYRHAASPMTPISWIRAALLAGGGEAYVSHLSAAWLHGLLDRAPSRPHITVPAHCSVRGEPLKVTRTRHPVLPVVQHGFRCTSAARTILDCATLLGPEELDLLVDRAVARRAIGLDALLAACRAADRHTGRRLLSQRLGARGVAEGPSPSVLESRLARQLRAHGLPAPKAEVKWGPGRRYRLDFSYPDARLVVEVNGWAYHSSPEQARRDAARRNALNRAGWTVLEFDWWEVTNESSRVVAEVAAALAQLRRVNAG